jgi:hypothetical protein
MTTTRLPSSYLLCLLERLADQLGIPVRYAVLATEELAGRGGLCVFKGEPLIMIERSLGQVEKARLLAAGLAHFDLEGVFIPPAVREAIEEATQDRKSDRAEGNRIRLTW